MKKVLERIYLAFKVLFSSKKYVDELFNEYKKKYILIKDYGYPTDEEIIEMADDYRKRKGMEELIKQAIIKPAMDEVKKDLN